MKYLKKFNEALSSTEIEKIEDEFFYYFPLDFKGSMAINPEDGTIDIAERKAVIMSRNKFPMAKLPFKFGNVPYQFIILNCPFTTLEGSPHTTQFFKVENTNVTDLVGSPKSVEIYLLENNRKLVSLKGLAYQIDQLEIKDCPITSLEGCPSTIKYDFTVSNTKITNLVGGPEEILSGDCFIIGDSITSLEGIPNVNGVLDIDCPDVWDPSPLRNLEIRGELVLECPISSLVAFFYTMDGFGDLTDYTFLPMRSWEKFKESLDYNYVRNRDGEWVIIHFKFMEALSELNWDPNDFSEETQKMTGLGEKYGLGEYRFVDEEGDYVDLLGRKLT